MVAGWIALVAFFLRIILSILRYYTRTQPNSTNIFVVRGPTIIVILGIILVVLAIGWWICGCIWVFRAWSKVQYIDPGRRDYCHPVLYRFAFWLLLVTIVCAGMFIVGIVRRLRGVLASGNKGQPTRVPTSEP